MPLLCPSHRSAAAGGSWWLASLLAYGAVDRVRRFGGLHWDVDIISTNEKAAVCMPMCNFCVAGERANGFFNAQATCRADFDGKGVSHLFFK